MPTLIESAATHLQNRLDEDAQVLSLVLGDGKRERPGEMLEQALDEPTTEFVPVLAAKGGDRRQKSAGTDRGGRRRRQETHSAASSSSASPNRPLYLPWPFRAPLAGAADGSAEASLAAVRKKASVSTGVHSSSSWPLLSAASIER